MAKSLIAVQVAKSEEYAVHGHQGLRDLLGVVLYLDALLGTTHQKNCPTSYALLFWDRIDRILEMYPIYCIQYCTVVQGGKSTKK